MLIVFLWGRRRCRFVFQVQLHGWGVLTRLQIWFQNRRQNDRRKSKPLQPHELLAPRAIADELREGDDNVSVERSTVEQGDLDNAPSSDALQSSFESDPVSGAEDKDEQEQSIQSSQTSLDSETSEAPQQPTEEAAPEPEPEPVETPETTQPDASQLSTTKRKRSVTDLRGGASAPQPAEKDASKDFKSPPSLRISLSFDGEAMVRKEGEMTPSPPKGQNALRISMSSDGKAVIRTDDEPSPSKNRISMFSTRKTHFTGLRRSNSAILPATPRVASSEKERMFGRSRDPRNWESVFDTDARSALSTPGSAQSAPHSTPGLFRSRGQRSLTRSLSSRRNAFANNSPSHPETPMPMQAGDKRRKLSRTVSSLGRLESNRANALGQVSGNSLKMPKLLGNSKKNDEDFEFHNGDSDKENWIPGTRISNVRRRTTTSNMQRPALRDANSKNRRSRLSQAHQQRKTAPEVEPEVSAFMANGGSASQEEDLDCIQGLLSLSQGAWR